jgi:UDP-N-acetylglucosamine 3-dehydrogenase
LPMTRNSARGLGAPHLLASWNASPKPKCAAASVPFTLHSTCNLLIQNVFAVICVIRSPAAERHARALLGTVGMHDRMSGAAKDGPVRLGVIGVGIMGSNHARVLADLSGVEVVGIADPGASHRALLAQIVGCAVCDDVDELLELGIDAAVVAAPTHLHHDIALTCIRRGVHVLVEKPIASNVEEGRAIVAAAERAGVTLMVGHVERFNPAVQAIKDAIRGEDILSIAITRVGPFPPRMSNVGVVIDLAVHDIDLIRWFTDSEITEVQPQIKSAVAEREDIALLQFRTASGVLAQINTNWLTPFKTRTVHIATRKKYLIGDLLTRQVTECFGFQADGSYSMRHLSAGHAEPLRSELLAFVRAIREKQPPAVTGAEGVASLEVAMRCLQGDVTPAQRKPRRVVG